MLKQIAAISALSLAVVLFIVSFEGAVDDRDLGHAPSIQTSALDEQTKNPLTIQNLRNQVYDGGDIEVVKKVSENSTFNSFVVKYTSEGLTEYALMNVPHTIPVGGAPVVVVNHGYIPPEEYSTEISYKNISDYYARNGFLVLKPDYRGHGNSETDTTQSTSVNRTSYIVDVMNLISSIKSIPEANASQVFLYGHSMGGGVALEVLELSESILGASLWAPVSTDYPESILYFVKLNRSDEYNSTSEQLSNNFSSDDYYSMSAINFTNFIHSPLIIHHGTNDESVPYTWSENLDNVLTQNSVEHTFYTYKGENHNFTFGAWSTLARRDVEFFNSLLPYR